MQEKMELMLMVVLLVACAYAKPRDSASCLKAGIAKYNITFDTYWTEERFPKQFPTFRPHAQWAKMIGRTHSPEYRLWEVGTLCTAGVMEYVEKGSTEVLDKEVQGMDGILDIFNTRNLDLGIGSTHVSVLADPYHSKMSVLARLVPSPDWFVGLDSLELCEDGEWVDKLVQDLSLYDAGTDRGFTFTAPNWPEIPYKVIHQITSKLPNHPANSFFYPELDELPSIASITVQRVETIAKDKPDSFVTEKKDTLNDDSNHRPVKAYQPEEPALFQDPSPARPANQVLNKRPEFSIFRTDMRPKSYTASPVVSTPPTQDSWTKTLPPPNANARFPQSCVVSEWEEWSPCSKTCGYGTHIRTRQELVPAEHGGAPCPVMKQEQLCGSMRSCTWNHFGTTFGNKKKGARKGMAGRRRSTLFRRRKMRRQQKTKPAEE